MKKVFLMTMLIGACSFAVVGCGEKKTLHCDCCGSEVVVDGDSNMEEDWIIYCETCNEELFGDDPILGTE